MTHSELKAKFNREWKAKNSVLYVVQLALRVGSLIPLVITVVNMINTFTLFRRLSSGFVSGGAPIGPIVQIFVPFFIFVLMLVADLILTLNRRRAWKYYLSQYDKR